MFHTGLRKSFKTLEEDLIKFDSQTGLSKNSENCILSYPSSKTSEHGNKRNAVMPFVTSPSNKSSPRTISAPVKSGLGRNVVHKEVIENSGATVEITVKTKTKDHARKRSRSSTETPLSKTENAICPKVEGGRRASDSRDPRSHTRHALCSKHSTKQDNTKEPSKTKRIPWGDILKDQNEERNAIINELNKNKPKSSIKSSSIKSSCETIKRGISNSRPVVQFKPQLVSSRNPTFPSRNPLKNEINEKLNRPHNQFNIDRPISSRSSSITEDSLTLMNKSIQCYLPNNVAENNFTDREYATSFKSVDILTSTDSGTFSMFDPVRTLNFLIRELRGMVQKNSTDEHLQRIINDMEHTLRRIPTELRSVSQSDLESLVPTRDKAKNERSEKPSHTTIPTRHSPPTKPLEQHTLSSRKTNSKIALTLQKHLEETCSKMEATSRQMEETCNQLRNDKEKLHEELEHKAKIIGSLKSNEEHYLKTIGNLRADIEQLNNKVSEQTKILTNLSTLSFQLTNENKVIPSLREAQAKLNTRLEEASRENERLRTQLQMMKLEREKFHILLTSKDNELEKFKLEVKGIQELVADQLTNMKNFVNHEKARDHLDNIIRVVSSHTQSLGFDTELESIVSDVSHEPSGGGEGGRGPHCSSPTSSMSSSLGIYPSWQVISRISSATNQEIDTKYASDIVLLGRNSISLDRSKDFNSDVNFDEAHLFESSTPPPFASLQIYTILENNCENTPSRASFKLEDVTSSKLVDITQIYKSSDVAKVKSSDKVTPDLSPGKEDISETVRLHKWFEEIKSLKWWNKDVELPDPPRPFDDVTEPEVNSQISEMSGDRFTLNSDMLSLSEMEDRGK